MLSNAVASHTCAGAFFASMLGSKTIQSKFIRRWGIDNAREVKFVSHKPSKQTKEVSDNQVRLKLNDLFCKDIIHLMSLAETRSNIWMFFLFELLCFFTIKDLSSCILVRANQLSLKIVLIHHILHLDLLIFVCKNPCLMTIFLQSTS